MIPSSAVITPRGQPSCYGWSPTPPWPSGESRHGWAEYGQTAAQWWWTACELPRQMQLALSCSCTWGCGSLQNGIVYFKKQTYSFYKVCLYLRSAVNDPLENGTTSFPQVWHSLYKMKSEYICQRLPKYVEPQSADAFWRFFTNLFPRHGGSTLECHAATASDVKDGRWWKALLVDAVEALQLHLYRHLPKQRGPPVVWSIGFLWTSCGYCLGLCFLLLGPTLLTTANRKPWHPNSRSGWLQGLLLQQRFCLASLATNHGWTNVPNINFMYVGHSRRTLCGKGHRHESCVLQRVLTWDGVVPFCSGSFLADDRYKLILYKECLNPLPNDIRLKRFQMTSTDIHQNIPKHPKAKKMSSQPKDNSGNRGCTPSLPGERSTQWN